MHRFRLIAICLLGLFVASITSIALGQEVTEPAVEAPNTIVELLITWLPRLVAACAGLAAFFPSTNKVMVIVDAFAFNWNKARNDPAAQEKTQEKA